MRSCPACSAPNPEEARFCAECGATLPAAAAAVLGSVPRANWADALGSAPRTWSIGRTDENDIQLPYPVVSSVHLKITREPERWIFVDQGSTNGTWVDGQRLPANQRVQVSDRSSVRLGSVELTTAAIQAGRMHSRVVAPAGGGGKEIVIGRDDGIDIKLDSPMVSRRHATLTQGGGGWVIKDLGSANGTWVNGRRISGPTVVKEGDRVELGNIRLNLESLNHQAGPKIGLTNFANELRLDLHDVSWQAGNGYKILHDISLSVYPGELVLLMGPSGAGKSSLMYTMCGYAQPTSGSVRINGTDLYHSKGFFQGLIGYVPQKEIMPRTLTAREVLRYAARLRLPPDVVEQRVEEVLESLGLKERADVMVGRDGDKGCLSGGQQKRVNIGIELLPDPGILFLDEPTSGLDARAAMTVMKICRELADRGKPVVMTLHQPRIEASDMADNIILMKHGRLAYYGPVKEKLYTYFKPLYHGPELHPKITATDLAIDALDPEPQHRPPAMATDEAIAEAVKSRFNTSDLRKEYVDARLEKTPGPTGAAAANESRKGGLSQLIVLATRYAHMLKTDTLDVAMLALQAPIIAALILVVFWNQSFDWRFPPEVTTLSLADQVSPTLFFMAAAAYWLGCSNAARELVRERPLYQREQKQGLSASAYLGSKVLVQYGVVVIQTLMITIAAAILGRGHLAETMAVLTITGWAGASMGLFISSFARTEFFAVLLVPLVILPQLLLGGLIEPYGSLNAVNQLISDHIVVLRSSYDALALLEMKDMAQGGAAKLAELGLLENKDEVVQWTRRLPWIAAWVVLPLGLARYLVGKESN